MTGRRDGARLRAVARRAALPALAAAGWALQRDWLAAFSTRDVVRAAPWELRVCVDARLTAGRHGGVEQALLGLAAGLSRVDLALVDLVFMTLRGRDGWLRPHLPAKARIVHAVDRRLSAARPDRWRRSDGVVERSRAAVVHFPFQAAFQTAVPSVYQPWDLQHLAYPEFFAPEERTRREVTYRGACTQAAVVVVASRWVRDDLIRRYAVDPGKVEVIPVPPALTVAGVAGKAGGGAADDDHLPERYALCPAKPWPHKNHLRLVEALALLRAREGLRIPLVCSGAAPGQYAAVRAKAVSLGIEDQLHFAGFVESRRALALFERSRMVVLPSLYEGWGLPVLEAFAAGVPVACSNVTALPEVSAGAASEFNPLDVDAMATAISRTWQDEAARSAMIAAGRAVVARYDWAATAQQYLRVYRRAAAGGTG